MFDFLNRKKYSSLSDEELILSYKKNPSNIILDIIYQRYGHSLLAVAFKFLRNKVDAQDAVMNLFECLAQKLLKHDIQNFKSWLHATMRNECLMYIRKTKNYSFNLTIEQLEIKITADDSEEKNQIKENLLLELESSLLEIKKEQSDCIRLFYLEDKSYVEIADMLNLSLNNVKSAIQNGKRMLKLKLEKKGVKITEL